MNIKEVIILSCKFTGHDGLYNSDLSCACDLNDLMPCNQPFQDCELGYKSTHSKTGDWVIGADSNLSDEKIIKIIERDF